MTRRFEPREYQKLIIDFILKNPRCAVFADMGLGKTVSTLTAIVIDRQIRGSMLPIIVVAPLKVAATVWVDEVTKWQHLQHLKVIPILGTESQRMAALNTPDGDIYTIN